jgi:acyl-CoA thioesterase I
MGGATKGTSGSGASWKRRLSQSPGITAGVVLALILLLWVLWPSPYANVTNLDSRGSGIIAFGDSLTAGYGASAGEDYPTKLSTRTGVTVVNAGVSGDTTESARARLARDVLAHDPRIVIIGLGGNDYLRSVPITVTEENLRAIIRETQDAGAMVVLLGFTFPSLNANYGAMYERVAKEEGCLLIAGALKGILRDPALKSDAIHPNARGYDLMAERIFGPFGKLLRKARSSR